MSAPPADGKHHDEQHHTVSRGVGIWSSSSATRRSAAPDRFPPPTATRWERTKGAAYFTSRLRQDLPEAFHPRDSALIRAPLGDERLELTTWLRPRQEARVTLPPSADRRGRCTPGTLRSAPGPRG